MALQLRYEKLGDIPVAPDSISYGSIAANGISTFVKSGNTIFAGSYDYETISINLKGITTPPYAKPGLNPGTETFDFRGRVWTILRIEEGSQIVVANQKKFLDWTITGVDLENPRVTVS